MNRSDFQTLAEVRIKEALVLLENQCYEGAYYLAGYAVECALKACIAKNTNQYDFPPDRNRVNRIYSHNVEWLLREAGLEEAYEERTQSNLKFAEYWGIVVKWSETSRYETSVAMPEAAGLYLSITDQEDGVLTWLSQLW